MKSRRNIVIIFLCSLLLVNMNWLHSTNPTKVIKKTSVKKSPTRTQLLLMAQRKRLDLNKKHLLNKQMALKNGVSNSKVTKRLIPQRRPNFQTRLNLQRIALNSIKRVIIPQRSRINNSQRTQNRNVPRKNDTRSPRVNNVRTKRTTQGRRPPCPARLVQGNGRFQWPIKRDKFWISSYYGTKSRGRLHAGLDLAALKGTPIYASSAGKVEFASDAGTFGNMVLIKHDNRYKSRYAHLNRILVPKGRVVQKGQLIGLVGNTGNVSGKNGDHLHFEILANDRPVNPVRVLR